MLFLYFIEYKSLILVEITINLYHHFTTVKMEAFELP
jgi:hypothetical protein